MFQFNTHYLADEPRDGPYFGAAVWPVPISYRCDNFQVCTTCSGGTCGAGGPPCYTFFGMWWPEQAGNRWHRPADRTALPYPGSVPAKSNPPGMTYEQLRDRRARIARAVRAA